MSKLDLFYLILESLDEVNQAIQKIIERSDRG